MGRSDDVQVNLNLSLTLVDMKLVPTTCYLYLQFIRCLVNTAQSIASENSTQSKKHCFKLSAVSGLIPKVSIVSENNILSFISEIYPE